MQPLVRVRFLVALVVLFGVLASVAGAVAAQKSREVDELRDLLAAQDAIRQATLPDGIELTSQAGGCSSSARSMCLRSDLSPRETALAVARALGLSTEDVRERVEPEGLYDAHGTIGTQAVTVFVEPAGEPGRGRDDEGAAVDVNLHDGTDVLSEDEWRARSVAVD
jgi:hypothetical protein